VTPPRVLVPDRALRPGGAVVPPADVLHHLRSVLRLKAGEEVTVVDGDGVAWSTVLSAGEGKPFLEVCRPSDADRAVRESACWVLVMGLLKGDRTDWAVQKATEAGVAAVLLAVCDRSVPRPAGPDIGRRADRARKVAAEAARQAGRAAPPRVDLFGSIDLAVESLPGLVAAGIDADLPRFVLDEAPGTRSLATLLATGAPGPAGAVLAVGPEGSFAARERALLASASFVPAGLGPRVLRAETAAVAAVIVAQAVAGDMR